MSSGDNGLGPIVRDYVAKLQGRSFVEAAHIAGELEAVAAELRRMAEEDQLVHVHDGLFYKGVETGIGMSVPRNRETGIYLGGVGAGLSRVSAANGLGLSTQVPSVDSIAVPMKTLPSPPPLISFVVRPTSRRDAGLTMLEATALEIVIDGTYYTECDWETCATTIAELFSNNDLRLDAVDSQVHAEGTDDAVRRWDEVLHLLH